MNSVCASYGGKEFCICDLSFSMVYNGITALLGESGSGKTSILRLFAGFLRPCSGSVMVAGAEVASPTKFVPPEKRRVGVLFQDYALFPHLSVAENILFSVPKKLGQAEKVLRDLLAACQLNGELARRRPHELSGGQQQRVALARVLASRPRLLILDEPFNSVDADLRERMLEHVKELVRHYKMRLLYITHDRTEAFQIADQLAIIRNGQLLQQGPARELYERPLNAYVARYFDKANILPLCAPVGSQSCWSSPVGPIPVPAGATSGVICLRPHQLEFCHKGGGPARVVEQRYYGSYSETHCLSTEFSDTRLIVRGAAPGGLVRIRPLPTVPLHFLPATSISAPVPSGPQNADNPVC